MRFSQRIGKKDIRQVLQTDSIDKVLENRLWNNILNDFIGEIEDYASSYEESRRGGVFKYIWENFYEQKADEMTSYTNGGVYTAGMTKYIKNWFLEAEWYEKYDLIEFLSDLSDTLRLNFTTKVNYTLKKELAGYTVIQTKLFK